jgi:hypothetical protein
MLLPSEKQVSPAALLWLSISHTSEWSSVLPLVQLSRQDARRACSQ